MYPYATISNPPAPSYPEYGGLLQRAKASRPTFVDPANPLPALKAALRRGGDWCTAVLGRPTGPADCNWWSATEHQLVILADRDDVDPPLPDWVVDGRRAADEYQRRIDAQREAARDRDRRRWVEVLANVTVELDVYHGTRSRVRGSLYDRLAHAVPSVDAHSGRRTVRVHRRGRPLCESPTRTRPKDLDGTPAPTGTPVTCTSCLTLAAKVRPAGRGEEGSA